MRSLIDRVVAAGCEALCVTADSPAGSVRDRQYRVGLSVAGLDFPNLAGRPGPRLVESFDEGSPQRLVSDDIERPHVYGLAVGGEAGVKRVLQILNMDLRLAMALCGRSSIARIGPEILHQR